MRLQKTLNKEHPIIHIEDLNEEILNKEMEPVQSLDTSRINQVHQEPWVPPYLERLYLEKQISHPEFDLQGELTNMCVGISLFQEINDIPT